MSGYEQVLKLFYGPMWPYLSGISSSPCAGFKVGYSKLFISMLINAIRQTYQQYFTVKISTISHSSNPIYLSFDFTVLHENLEQDFKPNATCIRFTTGHI